MAEEHKSQQLVQMSTVFASGVTAIVAALFTSKLGVAGTLVGTALTPMLMTIGVAILNAQFQKATNKISELPSTVRGHLSTQRVRVPGTPTPEGSPPEERADEREETIEMSDAARRSDRNPPGFFKRVLSIPTYLKEMSPTARRRTLITGALAGLVAAAIGLVGVTGVEAASKAPLSCTVWNECASTATGQTTGDAQGTSLSRLVGGGSGGTNDQYAPSSGGEQPGAQPAQQGSPSGGQYQGSPQSGGQSPFGGSQGTPSGSGTPQDQPASGGDAAPGATPQDGSQQPASPGAEQPAAPSGQQQQ